MAAAVCMCTHLDETLLGLAQLVLVPLCRELARPSIIFLILRNSIIKCEAREPVKKLRYLMLDERFDVSFGVNDSPKKN
jgi:hypothetical protein